MLTEDEAAAGTSGVEATFAAAGPVPAPEPTPSRIRDWARAHGIQLSDTGRIPKDVVHRYREAHALG